MNTIDGIIEDLELEDSCVGGCTTKGEIIACLENLKVLQKEKESVVKALEDVRAEIEALGIWHDKVMLETIDINRVLEVINDKIKEIKHE